MADNPEYKKPVQDQPNVAHDPAGQPSIVRGVPVELHGRTVDEKTGLPKPADQLDQQERQVRDLQPEDEKPEGNQER